jgi:hypothetical protein
MIELYEVEHYYGGWTERRVYPTGLIKTVVTQETKEGKTTESTSKYIQVHVRLFGFIIGTRWIPEHSLVERSQTVTITNKELS